MSVLRKHGEMMFSEFIEYDLISAIETGLKRTFCCRHRLIEISRISQSDVNELEYEGVITTIVPLYIQFRRFFSFNETSQDNCLLKGRIQDHSK